MVYGWEPLASLCSSVLSQLYCHSPSHGYCACCGSEKGFMNDISCPGFCCCWTLCPVSSRRYQASAFAATCHHCDCGCIFHTSSVGPWFFGLGFLMAETLLVVDTSPCGVVLFARSKEKCTHQSVEFIKEWDFHRSLIYETANRLLWP